MCYINKSKKGSEIPATKSCVNHFNFNDCQTWTRCEARYRRLCVVPNTVFPTIHCGRLIAQSCSFQNGSTWYSTCLGTLCPRSPGTPIAVKRASWNTKKFNTCGLPVINLRLALLRGPRLLKFKCLSAPLRIGVNHMSFRSVMHRFRKAPFSKCFPSRFLFCYIHT